MTHFLFVFFSAVAWFSGHDPKRGDRFRFAIAHDHFTKLAARRRRV